MSESTVAGTAAFAKFMAVLQAVADAAEPPSVAALARACGYPRSTVHRIVAALAEQGMLREVGGGFGVGTRVLGLASRAWSQFEVRDALAAELRALRDATGETVHLAVPTGRAMMYIDKLESPGPLRMVSRVGATVAAHRSAVGRAWLAALDAERCASSLAALPDCDGAARDLLLGQTLPQVRLRGYALDDQENEAGICCYGVALRRADGEVAACVSVSVLCFRAAPDAARAYVAPLLALRDRAQSALGLMSPRAA
ncbi:MAG: IclR family transcriptional regulator [Bordetella sp.]|nr:IclR family transcriptional regulator [Bordetella sp.]